MNAKQTAKIEAIKSELIKNHGWMLVNGATIPYVGGKIYSVSTNGMMVTVESGFDKTAALGFLCEYNISADFVVNQASKIHAAAMNTVKKWM